MEVCGVWINSSRSTDRCTGHGVAERVTCRQRHPASCSLWSGGSISSDRNAECGMLNAECGMLNAEVRSCDGRWEGRLLAAMARPFAFPPTRPLRVTRGMSSRAGGGRACEGSRHPGVCCASEERPVARADVTATVHGEALRVPTLPPAQGDAGDVIPSGWRAGMRGISPSGGM